MPTLKQKPEVTIDSSTSLNLNHF